MWSSTAGDSGLLQPHTAWSGMTATAQQLVLQGQAHAASVHGMLLGFNCSPKPRAVRGPPQACL